MTQGRGKFPSLEDALVELRLAISSIEMASGSTTRAEESGPARNADAVSRMISRIQGAELRPQTRDIDYGGW